MINRMTTEQLEAIRKRAEAATGGDWYVNKRDYSYGKDSKLVTNKHVYIAKVFGGNPDAEFISAARTDIPALLAEVERLRAGIRDVMDYSNGYEYYGELRELLGGGDTE